MTAPLYVFIGVIIWDCIVLLLDLALKLGGYETISAHCWAEPILAVELLLIAIPMHIAGLAGLAMHLLIPPSPVTPKEK